MAEISRFLGKYVPGFQGAYVAQTGVQVGVRETRRIVGEWHLTAEELLSARRFPDVIARGTYRVDIHNPVGSGTILKRLPPGEAYDIPLRALLPLGVERLIGAGRCISGTHEAHSSYGVMPISMATGPAAGACAALAAQDASSPRARIGRCSGSCCARGRIWGWTGRRGRSRFRGRVGGRDPSERGRGAGGLDVATDASPVAERLGL